MGMSASQARLLSITARINDLEYRSQTIANVKIRLADESEQLAQNYTNALNKQKYTFSTFDKTSGAYCKIDLTPSNLNSFGFQLVDKSGKVFDKSVSASQMYDMIESGEYMLRQFTEGTTVPEGSYKGTWTDPSDSSTKQGYWTEITAANSNQLNYETDSTEFAKAEAEYNAANMKISKKEKMLDNELKKLDTEHNALQTEADSIKNLIGKNIEKSFSLFS